MRKLVFILSFIFSSLLHSQNFGNQWIDYSRPYYKFPVLESGLYRIPYQSLINAGIPLNNIAPEDFQLFARGEQIPIYIPNETDGSFDPSDYIEFYAEPNDGWLDTAFYDDPSLQANPYYSLISDSINYFLSWNIGSNRRYQEQNNINFNDFFAANYVIRESRLVFNSNYYDGQTFPGGATDPNFTKAEGWMDQPINLGRSRNRSLSMPAHLNSGVPVELSMNFVGASNATEDPDHHFRMQIGSYSWDTIFNGYELIKYRKRLPASVFFDGNNGISLSSIDDLGASADRMAVAFIDAKYPASLNFNNIDEVAFWVEDNVNQSASLLEISAFNGGSQPVLYDLSNQRRIRVVQNFSGYRAIVPNSGGRKRCYLINPNQIKTVSALTPVGDNGLFTDFIQSLSDSSFLIITHPQLFSEATTYAAYRRSIGFNPDIVQATDLYDQYAYGIPLNPLAIRGFVHQALLELAEPPAYLLLLGKSVGVQSHRKDAAAQAANLVPTYGNPATDNLMLAGLTSQPTVTSLPIGRISARNPNEVDIYLDKLIEYESAPKAKWMKEALHFAGGKSVGEADIYESYLNNYAANFSDLGYGGRVRLFRKSSSSPIQTTLADSIRTLINQGVSLMTFFGHASANDGFDISIDQPDQLQNTGRYPLMLANSCFTGNYHQASSVSTGEDYVLERNRGAIGYIATGNLGYAFYLNQYSNRFYQQLTDESYGSSIAEIMRQTAIQLAQLGSSDQLDRVALEMSYQGDPALVLNYLPLPDYRIRNESLLINPQEVSTEKDSFSVIIQTENIGRAIDDTVLFTLRRSFPDASKSDTTYVRELTALYYEKEVKVTLPIDPFTDVGENQLTLIIDPFNQIPEESEFNNRIDFSVLIRSGEIVPVFPYDQAIIGSQSLALSASTAYALETGRSYIFELDTTADFNSPFKQSQNIFSSGGVLSWQPAVLNNMPDSAVYFWRVSKQPASGEDFNWRSTSFQYIANRRGWSQAKADQFRDNEFLFLQQSPTNAAFEFTDNVKELYVYTKSSPTIQESFAIRYSVDADVRERNACGPQPGMLIAVLDSLSLESWETPYNGINQDRYYGQANFDNYCGADRQRSEKYFLFRQNDSAQMVAMRDFLLNEIPDGNYIIAYSWQNVDYDQINAFDPTVLGAFRQLGSNLIDSLNPADPFIFTIKKGDPSTLDEVKGDSPTDDVDLRKTLIATADFGEMTSRRIGGAKEWSSFYYSADKGNSADTVLLTISGVAANGSEELVFASRNFKPDSVLKLPDEINAYPFAKWEIRMEDEQLQTPPQLNFWHLYYEAYPDLAFAPNLYLEVSNDSLNRGEELNFSVAYVNPTQSNSDSILLNYRVESASGQERIVRQIRLAPLSAGDADTLELTIPSNGLSGRNRLFIELNPANDQPEQYRFNNLLDYNFYVGTDRMNPQLEVTFDGRRIMNREIVSARPEIIMQLQDDNQFLALDDTSTIAIYLRRPNGNEELVNFSQNQDLQFSPASLPDNKARVRYHPVLEEDGVYRLRVSARDKSGNQIGPQDYTIEFEVINRSTVTYLMNYPNPFSTSTRFVFTLTGSRIPDQIQIQIMTVTGKVVKQIDQFELGPIRIGKNISEYAWDGKDDYGDQLANGVYLYRVQMRIDGNNIERRETEVDKYFTKDFGKMYLLR